MPNESKANQTWKIKPITGAGIQHVLKINVINDIALPVNKGYKLNIMLYCIKSSSFSNLPCWISLSLNKFLYVSYYKGQSLIIHATNQYF